MTSRRLAASTASRDLRLPPTALSVASGTTTLIHWSNLGRLGLPDPLGVMSMKSLRARVVAGYGGGVRFVGAITMLWAMALGQATPDEPVPVPEPAVLPLMGLGIAALALMYRRKR